MLYVYHSKLWSRIVLLFCFIASCVCVVMLGCAHTHMLLFVFFACIQHLLNCVVTMWMQLTHFPVMGHQGFCHCKPNTARMQNYEHLGEQIKISSIAGIIAVALIVVAYVSPK